MDQIKRIRKGADASQPAQGRPGCDRRVIALQNDQNNGEGRRPRQCVGRRATPQADRSKAEDCKPAKDGIAVASASQVGRQPRQKSTGKFRPEIQGKTAGIQGQDESQPRTRQNGGERGTEGPGQEQAERNQEIKENLARKRPADEQPRSLFEPWGHKREFSAYPGEVGWEYPGMSWPGDERHMVKWCCQQSPCGGGKQSGPVCRKNPPGAIQQEKSARPAPDVILRRPCANAVAADDKKKMDAEPSIFRDGLDATKQEPSVGVRHPAAAGMKKDHANGRYSPPMVQAPVTIARCIYIRFHRPLPKSMM